MKSIRLTFCISVIISLFAISLTSAANHQYPPELARIIECYPNGEVHNAMKKENEVAAAVLAVGATDDDEVFGFYKDSLSTKGWKVGPKMKNPVMKMSVMEFTKGNSRLNVGTMDYNIGKKKGIMINLSLEQ